MGFILRKEKWKPYSPVRNLFVLQQHRDAPQDTGPYDRGTHACQRLVFVFCFVCYWDKRMVWCFEKFSLLNFMTIQFDYLPSLELEPWAKKADGHGGFLFTLKKMNNTGRAFTIIGTSVVRIRTAFTAFGVRGFVLSNYCFVLYFSAIFTDTASLSSHHWFTFLDLNISTYTRNYLHRLKLK